MDAARSLAGSREGIGGRKRRSARLERLCLFCTRSELVAGIDSDSRKPTPRNARPDHRCGAEKTRRSARPIGSFQPPKFDVRGRVRSSSRGQRRISESPIHRTGRPNGYPSGQRRQHQRAGRPEREYNGA